MFGNVGVCGLLFESCSSNPLNFFLGRDRLNLKSTTTPSRTISGDASASSGDIYPLKSTLYPTQEFWAAQTLYRDVVHFFGSSRTAFDQRQIPFQDLDEVAAQVQQFFARVHACSDEVLPLCVKAIPMEPELTVAVNSFILMALFCERMKIDEHKQCSLGLGLWLRFSWRRTASWRGRTVAHFSPQDWVSSAAPDWEGLAHFFSDLSLSAFRMIDKVIKINLPEGDGSEFSEPASSSTIEIEVMQLVLYYQTLILPDEQGRRFHPHFAVGQILNANVLGLSKKVLNHFVEMLSFYPPGSFVRLSDGSFAQVWSVVAGQTKNPWVQILFSREGKKLDPPLAARLSAEGLTIAQEIAPEKIPAEMNQLLVLKARQWWISTEIEYGKDN